MKKISLVQQDKDPLLVNIFIITILQYSLWPPYLPGCPYLSLAGSLTKVRNKTSPNSLPVIIYTLDNHFQAAKDSYLMTIGPISKEPAEPYL
jgi:hypothetical protein